MQVIGEGSGLHVQTKAPNPSILKAKRIQNTPTSSIEVAEGSACRGLWFGPWK